MSLTKIRGKAVCYGLGLTAGASGEGIDAALVRIKGRAPDVLLKFIKHQYFPYTPAMQARLLAARKDARALALLHFELGERLSEAALDMQAIAREEECEVDFIGSTGYTVAHFPPRGSENSIGALQLGEPALIAERTEVPVVSDFQARDMAAGGQGSLLRPYVDWLLFRREAHTVACLHLGALATVTVVTPRFEELLAFDIGPCNMAIDNTLRMLSHGNLTKDKGGALAAKGVVIDEFLEYLLDHRYYSRVPPKSTGRDEFGPEVYLRDAISGRRDHSMEDLVATVTSAVAYSVIRAFTRFVQPHHNVSRVIITGGGALNKTLLNQIKAGLKGVVVRSSDRYGLPFQAMDAVGAALLAHEAIFESPGNAPSATGARRPVVLGRITPV